LHIVLFPTSATPPLSNEAAVIELTLSDISIIFSISRLLFFPLGGRNENVSANVVLWHSGLLQNIFLFFITMITFLSCIGKS